MRPDRKWASGGSTVRYTFRFLMTDIPDNQSLTQTSAVLLSLKLDGWDGCWLRDLRPRTPRFNCLELFLQTGLKVNHPDYNNASVTNYPMSEIQLCHFPRQRKRWWFDGSKRPLLLLFRLLSTSLLAMSQGRKLG